MSDGRAHSSIGASSMHRWAACPGSVRLSAGIPNVSSAYAEEGTLAHEVASAILFELFFTDDGGSVDASFATVMKRKATPEMLDAIEVYIGAVLRDREWTRHPEDKILIEHRFDLSKLHPGLFGTADCVIYHAGYKLLRVIDYKHGQGIPVEVFEDGKPNVQLMYYGLGALMSLGWPCDEVELVIVQPRCYHPDGPIRRYRLKAMELLEFAADLVDFAKATEEPDAPLHPGDHCRFCLAQPHCPALKEKALALAKEEFSPTLSYSPEKLAETLTLLDAVENWAKSVREFAYREAQHGRVPPGFKLVAKRASRKWKAPDEEIYTALVQGGCGLNFNDMYTRDLLSPAQIEKKLSKDKKKMIEDLVVSISSGETLVPASDKRQPLKVDAQSEFDLLT